MKIEGCGDHSCIFGGTGGGMGTNGGCRCLDAMEIDRQGRLNARRIRWNISKLRTRIARLEARNAELEREALFRDAELRPECCRNFACAREGDWEGLGGHHPACSHAPPNPRNELAIVISEDETDDDV